jgi:2-methylcitrate dehydratase
MASRRDKKRDEGPAYDALLMDIAAYTSGDQKFGPRAYELAHYCLVDSLGCAVEALKHPACAMLLGPTVPDTDVAHGARVPGTNYKLDPVRAAFTLSTMIRWLDSNDTFLAAERGHPSDNIGAILGAADYVSRRRIAEGTRPLIMRDVLTAMIKAYEIHGGLALENSFTQIGLDHAILIRVASTAVATHILGGSHAEIANAVSNAWADGAPMKVYRQAPNTGSRKSWAAGDAASRGVQLALMALKGVMGYPTVLSAKTYGFYDAVFHGNAFRMSQPFKSYIIENILFKSVPAEMMTQTAAECAFRLHSSVRGRSDEIAEITIETQGPAMGIVDKRGILRNPADRDHCIQYVAAVGLLEGSLRAEHFEDEHAADPRIDALRAKMRVSENAAFTRDFYAPEKRSSANALQVRFKDGAHTERVCVEFPIGHPKRRREGLRMVEEKFQRNISSHYSEKQRARILEVCASPAHLSAMTVPQFVDAFVV